MFGNPRRWLALCAALLLCGSATGAGEAPVRVFEWTIDAPWFGGFSGIEISDDGAFILTVGDRGVILAASLQREKGLITAIDVDYAGLLKDHKGRDLQGYWTDPEGIAARDNSEFCLAFEGIARVVCHETPETDARMLPRPHAFRALPSNRSLEALAVDDDGRLIALAEHVDDSGRIPFFVWTDEAWSIGSSVAASDGYIPVGADIGPDGRFYILERALRMVGFQSRLRRWDYADGAVSGTGDIVWESSKGSHDNLEGVALWKKPSGQIWATMISDDNFRFFQRTEIVEIPVPD
ncbi:MAG: esterase-like activity of phytase family protein [Pseudomonadota bacterium]